jgi:hypothetical protein
MTTRFVAALLCIAIETVTARAQVTSSALQRLTLLDRKEMEAVERGEAVALTLDSPEKTEIATLGVVRIEAPRTFYVDHVSQLSGFLATGMRLQAGDFSEHARPEDMSAMTLDPSDAKALERCQPLKCDVKLPAQEMELFRAVLARTHDPLQRADSLMREWLAGYVNAYRADSTEETVVYDDTRRPVRSSEAFRALVAEPMPDGLETEPFRSMLATSRSARPRSMTSRISWEMDHVPGLKPTLEVVERSILASASQPDESWMTAKLLYASHYFESAIEYLTITDAPSAGAQGASYLFVVRRQKFDDLPSGGLFNIRGKAVRKLRDALRTSLTNTRADIGAADTASQSSAPRGEQ